MGKLVLPLGLRLLLLGACDPVGAEFEKLVGFEGLVCHAIAEQDGGERLGVWLPGIVQREFRLRGMCV